MTDAILRRVRPEQFREITLLLVIVAMVLRRWILVQGGTARLE